MNQEIMKRESNAPAVYQAPEIEVLKSDIIVPYVILAQGMSEAVVERAVQQGDIYRSTTREVLGCPDKPIDVILLHYPTADWVIEQKTGSRFEFRKTLPRNASNETLEWQFWADHDGNEVEEGTKGATEWRRVKRMTVFALLPSDIEAQEAELQKAEAGELPDPTKALTPVILSFRSSSYKAGKECGNFVIKAKTMKQPPYRYMIQLCDYVDKNDEGTFYVWKVDQNKVKPVPKEFMPMVEEWAKLINSGVKLRADDSADTAGNSTGGERAVIAEEV